ncbi:hypothetical protein [Streptomyces sp. NPDC021224]|uniref:hypothetical protein n=1 Tax=unclassified Streptomyces TaxID=2593676 RepID=UPI0037A4D57F
MSGQLFTLLGVLAGAVASYVGATRMEGARWRRQLETRWDERRLEAYLGFANAIKRFTSIAGRLAATRGLSALPQPLDLDTGLALLAEAEQDRGHAFEAVLLMGDADAITAARALQRDAWTLERFVRTPAPDDTPADWTRAFTALQDRRDTFYLAARHDLGVTSAFRLRSEDPPAA